LLRGQPEAFNMPPDINEADWKVLRRVHPLALERFCGRTLGEVERIMHNGALSHHGRYVEIFNLMRRRDGDIARLFDDPRRSRALTMLAHMRSDGVLTEEEFSSLSQQTRNAVHMLIGAG
jgi:hypothetical protein